MAGVHMILVVIAIVRTAYGLSCISCDKTTCHKPLNCKAGLVKGLCGCCDVCAKSINERCGGPWNMDGKCAKGLKCVSSTQLENQDRPLLQHFKTGLCKPDACQNVTCGFRQKCKVNRARKPICICPRRCGKAKFPVCGLLNGKQYRNKCKLRREECLTKREIGLISGQCKKCTYKGKEFRFGKTRPDGKPCETCTCHHGKWKCNIRPDCFVNNLPVRSEKLSCLVSNDRKRYVLPCPMGFSCRVPRSNDFHDSLRAGVCKPKKVKRPKTPPPLLDIQLAVNKILIEEKPVGRRMPAEEYRDMQVYTEIKTTSATISSTSAPSVNVESPKQQNGALMKHVCSALPDKRSCSTQTSVRWFYNTTTQSCVQFVYGECGGNFNNFLSKEKCEEVCQSDSHPTANTWPKTASYPSPMYVSTQIHDGLKESRVLLDMCHDMNSGISYRNGEKWHIDECTSCSCVSGHALCVAAACSITCLNPIYMEGKCCPICKSETNEDIIGDGANVKCNDQETEQWYHSGESWDRDNCTKCVCFEGEISCSALVCTNQKCSNPIVEEKNCCPVCLDKQEKTTESTKDEQSAQCRDETTGKIYLPGEGWNINDCVSCFCRKDGQPVCHETKCSSVKCDNAVHLQGRCCPVCPEVFHTACIYDNHQYFMGDFMLLNDRCTLCKCKGNKWNCTTQHCNTTAKNTNVPSYQMKPTSQYNMKLDHTTDSEIYVNTKMMENKPTRGKTDDFIVEDPARMTRRYMKNFFTNPKSGKGKKGHKIRYEQEKVLSNTPITGVATRKRVPLTSDRNIAHTVSTNYDESSIIWEPSEKPTVENKLPWLKDFDHKMWANWDEPDNDSNSLDEGADAVDMLGMKKL